MASTGAAVGAPHPMNDDFEPGGVTTIQDRSFGH
jgi:hypothetical protein